MIMDGNEVNDSTIEPGACMCAEMKHDNYAQTDDHAHGDGVKAQTFELEPRCVCVRMM